MQRSNDESAASGLFKIGNVNLGCNFDCWIQDGGIGNAVKLGLIKFGEKLRLSVERGTRLLAQLEPTVDVISNQYL